MTVYVFRNGELVEKSQIATEDVDFPRVSRLEPYQSPVNGNWITSQRQRERDLAITDSYDKRDFKPPERKQDGRHSGSDGQQLSFWK